MSSMTPKEAVKVKPAVTPASFNFALRSNLALIFVPWLERALAQQTRAGSEPSRWSRLERTPDAYQKIPTLPEHTWACLVVYAHEGQAWWRRYHSMLFGLPLAVSAFNRLPFLLQAAVRRCLAILCSFYFDDATAQDFDFCAAESQSMLEECVSLLGYAFAEAKRQTPSSQGDFLGIVHDLKDSLRLGRIPLWIRPRLIDKIGDLMDTAEAYNSLPPGLASKLFGCLGFLDQGAFGKVARIGLRAIKERQYSTDRPYLLDDTLRQSFVTVRFILNSRPRRVVSVFPSASPCLCAASDAAFEGGKGSGGLLVLSPSGQRLGTIPLIDDRVLGLWPEDQVVIAQLELLMIFQGLLCFPDAFRAQSGIWWVDNVAALMALVKGTGRNSSLDAMAQIIHLLLFHLQAQLWFEWIESKSNWTDSISRLGMADPFWRSQAFTVTYSSIFTELWRLPLPVLSAVFSFL